LTLAPFGDHPAMGFNRRKMKAEREVKAVAEAATRRATDAQVHRTERKAICARNLFDLNTLSLRIALPIVFSSPLPSATDNKKAPPERG
jgi:hypothetical protein